METNLVILEKKAIEAALKNDWKLALDLNKQILLTNPQDLNAQIRLGKAQIQTKNFQDAVKTFKNVLSIDPVNPIAQKNLAIAKEGKISKTAIQPKILIKEPGTTAETQIIVDKRVSLEIGQILVLDIKKASTEVYKDSVSVGIIEDKDILKSLYRAKTSKISVEASLIKQKNEKATILLSANSPIFKADKQDIKPYFKKGITEEEEPELEFSTEIIEEE